MNSKVYTEANKISINKPKNLIKHNADETKNEIINPDFFITRNHGDTYAHIQAAFSHSFASMKLTMAQKVRVYLTVYPHNGRRGISKETERKSAKIVAPITHIAT